MLTRVHSDNGLSRQTMSENKNIFRIWRDNFSNYLVNVRGIEKQHVGTDINKIL